MTNPKGPTKSIAEIAWVPITVALIGVIGSLGVAWITASHTTSVGLKPIQAASIGSQTTGQKLCSVVAQNVWRDSFIVPRSWKKETCKAYQVAVAAWDIQLGCVFDDQDAGGAGVILGSIGGGIPRPNCGW
jgi:hypothetical protein